MYLPFATDGSEGSDLLLSFEYSWFKGRDSEGRAEKFGGSLDSFCNINFFKRCGSSMRCLKFMKVKKERDFQSWALLVSSFHDRSRVGIKKIYDSTNLDKFTFFLVKFFSNLFIFSLLYNF